MVMGKTVLAAGKLGKVSSRIEQLKTSEVSAFRPKLLLKPDEDEQEQLEKPGVEEVEELDECFFDALNGLGLSSPAPPVHRLAAAEDPPRPSPTSCASSRESSGLETILQEVISRPSLESICLSPRHPLAKTPMYHITSSPTETPSDLTKTPMDSALAKTPLDHNLAKTPLSHNLAKTPFDHSIIKTPLDQNLAKTPLDSILIKTPLDHNLTKTPVDHNLAKTVVEPISSLGTMTYLDSTSFIPKTPKLSVDTLGPYDLGQLGSPSEVEWDVMEESYIWLEDGSRRCSIAQHVEGSRTDLVSKLAELGRSHQPLSASPPTPPIAVTASPPPKTISASPSPPSPGLTPASQSDSPRTLASSLPSDGNRGFVCARGDSLQATDALVPAEVVLHNCVSSSPSTAEPSISPINMTASLPSSPSTLAASGSGLPSTPRTVAGSVLSSILDSVHAPLARNTPSSLPKYATFVVGPTVSVPSAPLSTPPTKPIDAPTPRTKSVSSPLRRSVLEQERRKSSSATKQQPAVAHRGVPFTAKLATGVSTLPFTAKMTKGVSSLSNIAPKAARTGSPASCPFSPLARPLSTTPSRSSKTATPSKAATPTKSTTTSMSGAMAREPAPRPFSTFTSPRRPRHILLPMKPLANMLDLSADSTSTATLTSPTPAVTFTEVHRSALSKQQGNNRRSNKVSSSRLPMPIALGAKKPASS